MSTITTTMTDTQTEAALSAAIGVIGEFRLLVDLFHLTDFAPTEQRMTEAQAGLIQMLNSLGDGRPAPKLATQHAARVAAAMGSEPVR